VQDRERVIDLRTPPHIHDCAPSEAEQARCDSRRTLQQFRALRVRCIDQRRLEQLADNAEGELALQLGRPRAQHAHPIL
jgi:hypothetical protein